MTLWCLSLAFAIPALAHAADGSTSVATADIDNAVIREHVSHGGKQATIISHSDLTKAFDAVSQWTLVVAQENVTPSPDSTDDGGPLDVCLVKVLSPYCYGSGPFHLLDNRVVFADSDSSMPMLFLKTCGQRSGDGDCLIATVLYIYDRRADQFVPVFSNVTGHNNNQATRFVESGPLRGDVVVDEPAQSAPYTYWIEVYRPGTSGRYARVLRYRGHTGYGDGNPLPVSDSEMPEILRRLGLWHRGDPLPVPHEGCTPVMRHGEEWCR
jgi:hypothetical protein